MAVEHTIIPIRIFNPFTPKSGQFQTSPAASPAISHHTVWRTWLFIAYSDERWLLYYQFSVHHIYILCLKGWEYMYFLSSGVNGLIKLFLGHDRPGTHYRSVVLFIRVIIGDFSRCSDFRSPLKPLGLTVSGLTLGRIRMEANRLEFCLLGVFGSERVVGFLLRAGASIVGCLFTGWQLQRKKEMRMKNDWGN